MKTNPLLYTADRVVLRRLSAEDLIPFQAYRSDPVVGRYQSWDSVSDGKAAAFLAVMSQCEAFVPGVWVQLGIALRRTNDLIGDIGVCVSFDSEHAEIGFTLASESQGQGLAIEAILALTNLLFESTPINRIVAITDSRNLPSIRLLERLGMKRVQTVDAIFRNEPCEEHLYELIRP